MPSSPLFKIAHISTAHGVRGEVKLSCFLENPSDIAKYQPLTGKGGAAFNFKITGQLKGQIIVKPDGIDDRNAAEALRGTELYADAAKRPEASANEYYLDELIGLPAMTADAVTIGKITGIENYGAGDIIQITTDSDELLLPFKDPYVLEVKKDAVIITLPEYLGEKDDE